MMNNSIVGALFLGALFGAALTTPSAVNASPRPNLIPLHDAVVTYHLEGGRDAPSQVKVFYQAGGEKIRIESAQQPGYILIDRRSGKAEMVMQGSNFGLETDIGKQIDQALNDPTAQFTPSGESSVAGVPCTQWMLHDEEANGHGCVSHDGLILAASGANRRGERMTLTAESVSEERLSVSLFHGPTQTLQLDGLAKFGKALRAQ